MPLSINPFRLCSAEKELLALTHLEKPFWFLINRRKSIDRIAYLLNIPKRNDADVERIVKKFKDKGWITFEERV